MKRQTFLKRQSFQGLTATLALCSLLTLAACDGGAGGGVDGRLSSAVRFKRQSPEMTRWLQEPRLYFMEAHVRFDPALDPHVIFGIDQELLEGTENPIHFKGADWMGLVGLQREGKIWVATGTEATMNGTPSKDRTWSYLALDQPLQPDTWYRLHSVVDYSTRRFVSFTVEGGGINRTFDLSAYTLDYPNMLPFNKRAMTDLVWAIGGKSLGMNEQSQALVYFDDVRSGLVVQGTDGSMTEQTLATEDFEDEGARFADQPWSYMDLITDKTIPLEKYEDGRWYLERGAALAKPHPHAQAHSGSKVAMMDARAENLSYDEWLKRFP